MKSAHNHAPPPATSRQFFGYLHHLDAMVWGWSHFVVWHLPAYQSGREFDGMNVLLEFSLLFNFHSLIAREVSLF